MKGRVLIMMVAAAVLGAVLATAVGAFATDGFPIGPNPPGKKSSEIPVTVAHKLVDCELESGGSTYDAIWVRGVAIFAGTGYGDPGEFYAIVYLADGKHLPYRVYTDARGGAYFRVPKGLAKLGKPIRVEFWAKNWGVTTHSFQNLTPKNRPV